MNSRLATTAAFLLAVGHNAWTAESVSPLSPACGAAMQSLSSGESAVVAARERLDITAARDAMTLLTARRAEVARACLGGPLEAPISRATLQPPVGVTTSPIPGPGPSSSTRLTNAPPLPTLPPAPTGPKPSTPSGFPTFITGCDAGGCQASDGTRMPRAGTGVLSPQGLCTVQGTLLNCGRP